MPLMLLEVTDMYGIIISIIHGLKRGELTFTTAIRFVCYSIVVIQNVTNTERPEYFNPQSIGDNLNK